MIIIRIYLLLINLATFCVWGRDKRQARVDQRNRIPEKKLLWLVAAGGGIGALLGMQTFRHKTIKGSFLRKALVTIGLWIVVGTVALVTFGS